MFGITNIIYPDSAGKTFLYDDTGNLIQKTDGYGSTIYTYDAVSQLISVTYPDQHSVSFEYDSVGNRITMTDPEGQTTYTHDTRNRLLSETRTIEGSPYPVNYTYDAASRLTSIVYPDQRVVTYEYDSLNRLTMIPDYAEFTYNANSLLEEMVYTNSTISVYQYDNRNRLCSLKTQKNDTDILIMNYQYDPVGNITELDYNRQTPDQQWTESAEVFGYDWLDRLVSAQGDYGLLTFSYDPVGNRLSKNDVTYTYNSMNELLSMSNNTSFTYDDNGNLVTKNDGIDTWSYTYERNNLIKVEKNQKIISEFTYDGDGKRITKTEWIDSLQEYHTTIYVYSGFNVIYEKNITATQEGSCIYGPTGRLARYVNGLTDYYHTDQLGSTRLVTDESGNVVTEAVYTPFGEPTVNGEEDFLYTGKEKDSTDLYYYNARYYDFKTGRFLTRDMVKEDITLPQTLNKYVYCMNNPLKYTDPTGNSAQDAVEEIFESLKNIDPDEYDEIQEKVDSGEMTELEAVKKILELMGYFARFSEDGNSLEVILKGDADGKLITVKIDNQLKKYGEYDVGSCTVSINFQRSGKVTDVGLILAHEISHATLTISKKYRHIDMPEQEKIIYGVQYSYMTALRYLGVEYSKEYSDHVFRMRNYHNPQGEHHVPISQILRRWLPPTSPVIF